MGVTPVWRRNDSIVTNSPPTSGTPGVYVREPANHERVLVLQNVTQSVVGTFVCLEGSGQDADIATFVVTTGKGVQLRIYHHVNILRLLWLSLVTSSDSFIVLTSS